MACFVFTPNQINLYFMPMSFFYTPGNFRKPKVFLTFLGGIEIGHWHEKG